MHTITIFNHKGGAGKTVTTLLLGRFLGSAGKSVLLVDLDPQGSLTDHLQRLSGKRAGQATVLSVLSGETTIEEAASEMGEVWLLPFDRNLGFAAASGSIMVLTLRSILQKTGYDFVILDCPPQWSTIPQMAIHAADTVLIPTEVVIDELTQTTRSFKIAREADPGPKRISVLINQYRPSKKTDAVLDQYRETFGDSLFPTTIPDSRAVRDLTDFSEFISTAKAKNPLFDAFADLARSFGVTEIPEKF